MNGFIETILILLAGLIGAFVGIYIREKGKNLATKEDIGLITRNIEEVKSVYTRDNEKLRAELQMIVNVQNSLHSDIKKAIVDFWDTCFLLVTLCDPSREEVQMIRLDELNNFIKRIEDVDNDLMLKQFRIHFLVQDQKFVDLSWKLYSNASKCSGQFLLFIENIRPLLERLKELDNMPLEDWNINLESSTDDKITEFENVFDKDTKKVVDMMDELIEEYKKHAHKLLRTNSR